MGEVPLKRVLITCLKGFIISEVNSESEQVRGPNSKITLTDQRV
jgi:hypothetical protein